LRRKNRSRPPLLIRATSSDVKLNADQPQAFSFHDFTFGRIETLLLAKTDEKRMTFAKPIRQSSMFMRISLSPDYEADSTEVNHFVSEQKSRFPLLLTSGSTPL